MQTIDRSPQSSYPTDRQTRSRHGLRDTGADRRAARWTACAGAALCLTFSISVFAAGANGMGGTNGAQGHGNGNGVGTQGPANDAMQGNTSGNMQGNMSAAQSGSCTPDQPQDNALVGKSVSEAKSMLRGCPWRIGKQDGKTLPTTRDHRPDRRTLTIENDKVTDVQRG